MADHDASEDPPVPQQDEHVGVRPPEGEAELLDGVAVGHDQPAGAPETDDRGLLLRMGGADHLVCGHGSLLPSRLWTCMGLRGLKPG
ncbi:hypothetical protein [Arenibaculum pallidiluteum]|uniref:hypothetical protein n=1 Tax=Arenibaculum pallidiluteum TaxID=2812559 RepID=UPI001F21C100|nr:hypothetical protein [Arenibaculum pallidiluteum]